MIKQLSGSVELIKKSFGIFFEKKNFIYFLEVYLPLIPFAVFSAVQQYFLKSNYPLVSWMTGVSLIEGIIYLLVYFWISVAGIYAVKNVISGGELSVGRTYKSAWNLLWKFSLLSILLFLIVAGGFLLLIIPGIIFLVWFTFAGFVLVDKNTKIKESLGLSHDLVRGNFWKVFGRILIFGIFFGVLQALVGFIPYGIGSILVALAGALFILPSFLLYRELSA